MNDHKPNRRARRAMQRVGNKIAERIIERKAIQKVERDEQYMMVIIINDLHVILGVVSSLCSRILYKYLYYNL